MAFAPPTNNAGLPIPAMPANPPTLSNITNTKDYVERLIQSKGTSPVPAERHQLIWVRFQQLAPISVPQTKKSALLSYTTTKAS
jgi:hypothetical protein